MGQDSRTDAVVAESQAPLLPSPVKKRTKLLERLTVHFKFNRFAVFLPADGDDPAEDLVFHLGEENDHFISYRR